MLDVAFGGAAIDDMFTLVCIDAPFQRSMDAYMNRRLVIA
jgi:hypothetical protein